MKIKLPMNPPQYEQLLRKFLKENTELYIEIISNPKKHLIDEYYHWDKLFYLEPPDNLTSEEWWFIQKLNRIGSYKKIPLLDKKKTPFVYLINDEIQKDIHLFDLNLGGGISKPEIEAEIFNKETKDKYYIRSLIEEAINSSQLEGAATTTKVAKELLRSGRKPVDKSEQMILNNYITIKHIKELLSESLSIELLKELHVMITRDTLDSKSEEGRFRNNDDDIVVSDDYGKTLHIPPNSDELEERIIKLCEFANQSDTKEFIHPIIKSIIIHFWLAYDHPFVDGNGRLARALFYWNIMKNDYWLFEYISISQIIQRSSVKYAMSFLYTESDQNDLTYFILYNLSVIKNAEKSLQEYIQKKSQEVNKLQNILSISTQLNHRQKSLLIHVLKHPGYKYTVRSHQRSQNVSNETAKKDLLELSELGYLKKEQPSNKYIFTASKDLPDLISSKSIT